MFKRTLLVLFFLFLPVSINTVLAQSSDNNLLQTIPLEISRDWHIFLRVRVNNSDPLLFGLDSGFEQSAITTKQAKALNLQTYGEAQVTGGGENTEDFSFTKDVSFDLSGVKFKLKEIGVLALDFPSPVPDETISGILGYDFISRFVVELDLANQVIKLYNPLFRCGFSACLCFCHFNSCWR